MKPEDAADYDGMMTRINAGIKKLETSVPTNGIFKDLIDRKRQSGNPYGTDVQGKAEAIARALRGMVDFKLDKTRDLVTWRLSGKVVPPEAANIQYQVTFHELMHFDFTDLDIANVFGINVPQLRGFPSSFSHAVSGNPTEAESGTVSDEQVDVAIMGIAQTMNLNTQASKTMIESMKRIANASNDAAESLVNMATLIADDDDNEAKVRARAEAGVDAIIMDIQASGEATLETAAKWMRDITERITAAIKVEDD